MNFFLVFVGGGIGSLCRYSLGLLTAKYFSSTFPLATFIANLTSCILLGFLIALFLDKTSLNSGTKLFFIVGFCGAYSTFSAFTADTVRLFELGKLGMMLFYVAASLAFCLAGYFLGFSIYKLRWI